MFEKNLILALNDEMKVLRREAIGRVSLQTNAFEFEMIKMARKWRKIALRNMCPVLNQSNREFSNEYFHPA